MLNNDDLRTIRISCENDTTSKDEMYAWLIRDLKDYGVLIEHDDGYMTHLMVKGEVLNKSNVTRN